MERNNRFAFCKWINPFSSSSHWLRASKPQIKNTKIRLFLGLTTTSLDVMYITHTYVKCCYLIVTPPEMLHQYIAITFSILFFAFRQNSTQQLRNLQSTETLKKRSSMGKTKSMHHWNCLNYYIILCSRLLAYLIFMEAEHSTTKKSLLLTKKRLDI